MIFFIHKSRYISTMLSPLVNEVWHVSTYHLRGALHFREIICWFRGRNIIAYLTNCEVARHPKRKMKFLVISYMIRSESVRTLLWSLRQMEHTPFRIKQRWSPKSLDNARDQELKKHKNVKKYWYLCVTNAVYGIFVDKCY